MNKKLLLALMLSGAIALTVGVGCGNNQGGGGSTTPPEQTTPGPDEGGDKQHTAPVITVNPKTIEIYAGDEIDLMLGVSAVDDEGNSVQVIISDDDDFDATSPEEGEYTITYSATAFELTSTATRTIIVQKELAPLTLETRTAFEKPGKWEKGTTINFKHREYHEVTEDSEFERMSGVFHNKSDKDVYVTVGGGGGIVAILDKNGVVIEGRDGANAKLVNAENPSRTSSTASSFEYNGKTLQIKDDSTKGMKIPAGGFAVVIQSGYLGADFDSDGRAFMDNVVIHEYGNVVRLQWSDAAAGDYLTEYVNQAPKVSGNSDIPVALGDTTFDLETAVKAGLKVTDDNETFEIDDDKTLDNATIQITDNGGFDIDKEGDYVITLSVSDGTLTTTFKRTVNVVNDTVKVSIGSGTEYSFAKNQISTNEELTGIGTYAFIIYDYSYKSTHPTLGFSNGYGVAYVIDRYGRIARTYDGADALYNDKDNNDKKDIVAPATYASQAYESLQEGETLIIAPNNSVNGLQEGTARWLLAQKGNRTAIGQEFHFTGLEFEKMGITLAIEDKTFFVEPKYYGGENQQISNPAQYQMIVYTKAYGSTNPCTGWGWGEAIVLDSEGKLIKVYDGVSGQYWENGAQPETKPNGFSAGTYAQTAYENLQEGEKLIVFPNSPSINGNAARGWAYGLRGPGSDKYYGKVLTIIDTTDPA